MRERLFAALACTGRTLHLMSCVKDTLWTHLIGSFCRYKHVPMIFYNRTNVHYNDLGTQHIFCQDNKIKGQFLVQV